MIKDKRPQIAMIVVIDQNNGIGRSGGLLCHLPGDLKHFKQLTTGHSVIMGRKTFESLPNGALPNRTNIVITSDAAENYPGCIVARSFDEAMEHCKDEEIVFIIGGGQLYHSTFDHADKLYLTRIDHTFGDADTFFPTIDFNQWELIHNQENKKDEKNQYNYTFLTYIKRTE